MPIGRKKRPQPRPKRREPPAPIGHNRPPAGQLIGYARVSTKDQSVEMQLDALRRAGVPADNLWHEVKSGVRAKRPQLELALTQAMRGDTFVVYKLDRFGRDLGDLITKMAYLESRGAVLNRPHLKKIADRAREGTYILDSSRPLSYIQAYDEPRRISRNAHGSGSVFFGSRSLP